MTTPRITWLVATITVLLVLMLDGVGLGKSAHSDGDITHKEKLKARSSKLETNYNEWNLGNVDSQARLGGRF